MTHRICITGPRIGTIVETIASDTLTALRRTHELLATVPDHPGLCARIYRRTRSGFELFATVAE